MSDRSTSRSSGSAQRAPEVALVIVAAAAAFSIACEARSNRTSEAEPAPTATPAAGMASRAQMVEATVDGRQIHAPLIEVNLPGTDHEPRQRKTVTVKLDVPEDSYRVSIDEVRLVGDEVWIVSRLAGTGPTELQDSSRAASDSVVLDAPADVDVKRYVVGRDVGGDSIEGFVDDRSEIADRLDSGALLYRAG